MEFIQNITIGQIAAFLVFIGSLYGGAKYLKKELKDGIISMLKERFESIDKSFENHEKEIKALKNQSAFLFKAIALLLEDDIAILEHLRTNNNTGKMSKQEQKVQEFLIERKSDIT